MSTRDHSDIVESLRALSDSLGERGMAVLREAIENGSGARPAEEKILSQARRAVDKAIALLGGVVRDD